MMVLIQLQSQNPPVLLPLNVTPGHRQTDQRQIIFYINLVIESSNDGSRRPQDEDKKQVSLGRVVNVYVLQQFGSEAVVGVRAR